MLVAVSRLITMSRLACFLKPVCASDCSEALSFELEPSTKEVNFALSGVLPLKLARV